MKHLLAILLTLLVAACASTPMQEPSAPAPVPSQPSKPSAPSATTPAPAPEVPSQSSGKGGYYKDDGPQDLPPADLDKLPDATPTDELPNIRYARPYKAMGKEYRPMKSYAPYQQQGMASWYGKRFHGNKTASGEIYDMNKMTAAHTTLPIPSYAKVTNLSNGKSIVVRVNDRGPFHKDRIIDLSYAAAYKLGFIAKGSSLVEVEAIDPKLAANYKSQGVSNQTASSKPVTAPTSVVVAQSTNTNAADISGYFVQVAAFKSQESANRMRDKVKLELSLRDEEVQSWYNNGAYKVRAGPYASRAEAEKLVAKVKLTLGSSAMILYHD
jgi:rare lipoprotein A